MTQPAVYKRAIKHFYARTARQNSTHSLGHNQKKVQQFSQWKEHGLTHIMEMMCLRFYHTSVV